MPCRAVGGGTGDDDRRHSSKPASRPPAEDAGEALRGSALAADTFDPLLLRTVVDCALHEHDVFARTVSELEVQRCRSGV